MAAKGSASSKQFSREEKRAAIELRNVWLWMKMQLASCNCTNIEELKGEIVRLWTTRMSDSDYLRNLVDSVPHRLQEVIDGGGASTHY